MRRVGFCMVMVATVVATGGARVDAALFGTVPNGSDTTLVVIDTSTGAATAVGPIGSPDVQGLAGRASDGKLFGGTNNAASASAGEVLTISPAINSSGTVLGPADSGPIGGMALSPTTAVMYATCSRFSAGPRRPDALCTVNQLTGELTPVNQFNHLDPGFTIHDYNGLAFSAAGVLYATTAKASNPASEPRLYTVDTTTGISSPVGQIRDGSNVQLNAGVVGLELVGSVLYGATDDGRIVTIDPATGVYTLVGSTGLGTVQGLADLGVVTPAPTATPTGPTPTATPGPCTSGAPGNPCIPGGGSTKTDCQVEWILDPVPLLKNGVPVPDVKNGIQRNRAYCYDGDVRCDFDGVKDNNSCAFQVGLCINNTDPRYPSCAALDLASFEVKRPNPKALRDAADTANLGTIEGIADGAPGGFGVNVFRGKLLQIPGVSNPLPNRCSARFDLVVPTKATARGPRKASKTFKLKAATSLGLKDADSLKLECRPSTCGNGIIESDHETCDDGNRNNGDGCNQACIIEVAPTVTPTPSNTVPPTATATFTPTATAGGPTATPTITPTTTPVTPVAPTGTPTNTPTATPSPTAGAATVPVALQPGGGTGGSCRGTCDGGLTPGASCGASAECLRKCSNSSNPCTSNANCPGGTCPTTNCVNRTCAGGPLNGTACTTAGACNGCLQSPPQGSCAIVQNPLFPVVVPLNGVCINGSGQRFNPPGDIPCTTIAECKTCVGGPNAGKTCRATTSTINDCGTGTCSGAATCKLGAFSLQVGTIDGGTNEAPLSVPQSSLFLAPAVVTGIGTVCVTAAGSASGQIDCDGGRANLDSLSRRDHNTVPGSAGNYGQRCKGGTNNGLPCSTEADCPPDGPPGSSAYCGGLPNDPECDDTTPQPDGSTSRACIEGTRRCIGGTNDGQLCAGFSSTCAQPSACWSINGNPPFACKGGPNDGQACTRETLPCPGGACTPCNTGSGDGPHPGICNSPTYISQSATFTAGDIGLGFPLALAVYGSGCTGGVPAGCFGPDGLACTADDIPSSPPSPVGVPLSTGTNQIYVFDASNLGDGTAISPETICSANPCIAQLSGVPAASCAALSAGNITGIVLGGGFPAFDTTAGDIATTFRFRLQ